MKFRLPKAIERIIQKGKELTSIEEYILAKGRELNAEMDEAIATSPVENSNTVPFMKTRI